MNRGWEKAKAGAKWLGMAGLAAGAVVGAVLGGLAFGLPGMLGGLIGGGLKLGAAGVIVGGAIGGVFGAVTESISPRRTTDDQAAHAISRAPADTELSAQPALTRSSGAFQELVKGSRSQSSMKGALR